MRVQPFRAFRPPAELAEKVAAPPYDVCDSTEARSMVEARGKMSFLRVNKPEVDLSEDVSQYDVRVYERGVKNLKEFIARGWLRQDASPSLYVYSQKMGEHKQYGVCAGVAVEDYATGKIKRHEKTQVKKENDRTRLTYMQNANVGPVFLTYRDSSDVNALVAQITSSEPDTRITADDGIEHEVWVVSRPQLLHDLRRAFAKVDCSYIADGHHRSASAFRVGEMKIKEAIARGETITGEEPFNWFLAVLFPASQLKIMEYNRAVKDLNGLTEEEFLNHVRVNFECEGPLNCAPQAAEKKGIVYMCLAGKWYRLKVIKGTYEENHSVASLDVQILYDNLLSPVLNIGNPRTDERIKFIGGIRGPQELQTLVTMGTDPWAVSFLMHPVRIEEVIRVSDEEKLMAPKATWFEPKLRSGLIVRLLGDQVGFAVGPEREEEEEDLPL